MSHRIFATIAVAALAAACGYQINRFTFDYWDKDNDRVLEMREFYFTYDESGFLNRWDPDSNQLVSREEFYNVYFKLWDANSDGLLSRDEWDYGKRTFIMLEDYENLVFHAYDMDQDEIITRPEFVQNVSELGYHREWDLDDSGFLDKDELSELLYALWDLDDDGWIGKGEYDAVHEDYYNLPRN